MIEEPLHTPPHSHVSFNLQLEIKFTLKFLEIHNQRIPNTAKTQIGNTYVSA